MIENYIKISNCKEGYLYEINARNANYGIYQKLQSTTWINSFLISRFKFSDNFLFVEYHYDNGEPYGTVKPLKEIEMVPNEILNGTDEQKLEYLNKHEQQRTNQ